MRKEIAYWLPSTCAHHICLSVLQSQIPVEMTTVREQERKTNKNIVRWIWFVLKVYINLDIWSIEYCKSKKEMSNINTAQNYTRSKKSGIFWRLIPPPPPENNQHHCWFLWKLPKVLLPLPLPQALNTTVHFNIRVFQSGFCSSGFLCLVGSVIGFAFSFFSEASIFLSFH